MIFLIVLVISLSCSKYELNSDYEKELTVEGYIDNGSFAKIYLTYNLPVGVGVDTMAMMKNMAIRAKVTLECNGYKEILSMSRNNSRYPVVYYKTNSIVGELGKEYKLTIEDEGKCYEVKSTVPNKGKIISFEFITLKDNSIEAFVNIENTSNVMYYKLLLLNSETGNYVYNTEAVFTNNRSLDSSFKVRLKAKKNLFFPLIKGEELKVRLESVSFEEYMFLKCTIGDDTQIFSSKAIDEGIPSNIDGAFGFFGGRSVSVYKVSIE